MTNRRRRIVSCAALVVTAISAQHVHVSRAAAQESFYSLQFVGISEETGDVRARGLGVLGIGIRETQTAITLNPASHAALGRMTLSVMGLAGQRTSLDSRAEDQQGMARFPHARFALPLPGPLVFSVGYVGLRNFRGSFVLPRDQIGGISYVQSFDRSGTLYAVPLGLAGSVGSWLQLGATLDLMFGTSDEAWTTQGDSIVALRTRRRDTFSGTSGTFGVQVRPWSALRIGLTASPSIGLERSTQETVENARPGSSGVPVRDTASLVTVHSPSTLRAGASFDIGQHWMVVADGMRREWSDYDGRLYGAEGVGLESRVGGGVEYRPARPVTWWGRMSYRAGASRTTWPQRLGGNRLRQTAVHVGAGFDLRGGHGRLDLGFEYGRTGSLETNGYRESSWRILLGLSGQETWRRRSPRAGS
jgi:hypothetical protein